MGCFEITSSDVGNTDFRKGTKLNLGCLLKRYPFIMKKLESEDFNMRLFYECKTEEEKQALRDDMLQTMYYQVIGMRKEVSDIQKRVHRMEQKLVYVGATPDERKYINVDGTLKLEAINEQCDNILKLFGNKYIDEVSDNGETER